MGDKMKNLKGILFSIIFLVLALGFVSAVQAVASFTVTDLSFGSGTQARGEDVTQTLTLTNTGTDPLTINLVSRLPTVYNTVFSQPSVTLSPNAVANVDVTITIPDSQSSQTTTITGGIVATSNVTSISRTAKVSVTAQSMLEITKVSILIDGNSEQTLSDSTDFIDDNLKAGTPFVIRVYAKNDFADSTNLDMTSAEASISTDGDLNIDDTQTIGDIRPTRKEYTEFSGTIPSDAQDGDTYSLDVTADAQDDNGAMHYAETTRDIRIERKTDEISIVKYKITPQTISCNGKVTITADLQNTGRYTEDNSFLVIENDQLSILDKSYSTSLKKDDVVTKTFSFNIDNKTEPGSYDFMLTSFYGSDKQSDEQVVTLTVDPCLTTTPTTTTTTPIVTNTNTNTQPAIPQVVPINGATPAYGSASFTDSSAYIIILVAAVIVILLILIILLVKFVF